MGDLLGNAEAACAYRPDIIRIEKAEHRHGDDQQEEGRDYLADTSFL